MSLRLTHPSLPRLRLDNNTPSQKADIILPHSRSWELKLEPDFEILEQTRQETDTGNQVLEQKLQETESRFWVLTPEPQRTEIGSRVMELEPRGTGSCF